MLKLALLTAAHSCRRLVWLILDSQMVVSLIRAVHGRPLKAVFRELAVWVEPYRILLEGWMADLWIVRMTSHSLSEWIQEADMAAFRPWPPVELWKKPPLRVLLRQLNSPPSNLHRQLVRQGVQQSLVERWALQEGPSSWLLRDPRRRVGASREEMRRTPCWPTPYRPDIHLGVACCQGPARWVAMRLAAARLPDYDTAVRRSLSRSSPLPFEAARCPRCRQGLDEAAHWLLRCRGHNGVAAKVRERHREIILKHLALDIDQEEMA